MLLELPLEVFELVLAHLAQNELVSLLLLSKSVDSALVHSKLFRTIEINSAIDLNGLNNLSWLEYLETVEATASNDDCSEDSADSDGTLDSYINPGTRSRRSSASAQIQPSSSCDARSEYATQPQETTKIKSIYNLKLFLKKLVANPHFCSLVQELFFMENLPDLPQDELVKYLHTIFPLLVNLKQFKWYSNYNLDLTLINRLPNKNLIHKLNGNFKNFNHFQNNSYKNLSSLSLSGFKNFENIKINLNNFKNLKKLKISKKNLNKIESDSLDKLLINSDKLNLTCLCLENLYISHSDTQILFQKINFQSIRKLKVLNCYEHFDHTEDTQRSFLYQLSSLQLKLTSIDLNVLNNLHKNDNVTKLLSRLANLRKIKVHLNLAEDLNSNVINLMNAILVQNNCYTLNCLDISFSIMKHNFSHHTILNLGGKSLFFKQLAHFKKLKVLKFPIHSGDFSILLNLLQTITDLAVLQLNLIDVYKFNNCLISHEYNLNKFENLILYNLNDLTSHLPKFHLKYIVFKMNEYYIFDCLNQTLNKALAD